MNSGREGLQKAQCWGWTGESAPLPAATSPKGCTDFLGKPGPGICDVSHRRPPCHYMERRGTGKMFLEPVIGASAGNGLGF